MPVKAKRSPSVNVSPMRMVPWFGTPMTSPGKASSVWPRSAAMKVIAWAIFVSRPARVLNSFMPLLNRPEHTRTKAMRSRCCGSMFAWILNTNPENFSSYGSIVRVVASRGCGGGACSTNSSSSSRTPKLLMAEPKNTGVSSPRR